MYVNRNDSTRSGRQIWASAERAAQNVPSWVKEHLDTVVTHQAEALADRLRSENQPLEKNVTKEEEKNALDSSKSNGALED